MPPERRDDDLALDRFWDDVVLGQPLRSEGVNPLDAVTIGRLHEAARPAIDPSFRRRLRRDLLGHGAAVATGAPGSAVPPYGVRERSLRWPAVVAAGLVVAGVVALGLLLGWGRTAEQAIIVPAVEVTVPEVATPPATPEAAIAPVARPLWRFTDARDPSSGIAPGITVAPDGSIWIVDGVTAGFQIFSPEGQLLGRWGTPGAGEGEFAFAAGSSSVLGAVAFQPDGGFYVADSGNARIQQFSADRAFVRAWSGRAQGEDLFSMPIDVDIDAEGNVYVTDARRNDIQKFTADGAHLLTFGGSGSGPGQFQDIAWSTVDAEGNVWVADPGNDRVQEFAPDGTFLRLIGSGAGASRAVSVFLGPQAVVLDAAGHIVIADTGNARIVVLAPDGTPISEFGKDMLDAPMALAVTRTGDLVVIDGGRRSALQAFQLSLPQAAPP